ncbi:2,3-bisphosphoglycerate-independent phosphoglycerate mutase [Halomonas sp. KAO]|uniref:2,3-bisphosphoglycerate-independent phosphoglycerate mutase n=1 Tax=unclassified Halomonas TaxID=2609666 RepID=UPI00189EB5DF|nr:MULTISPECIES: 2,3-bisphosphoglycerate-independent phosphoglycerate mutase [unclassified Halomonas]MBF7053713.1 2,3-bisphosphoglycerate-independent phosphoglycerate mutase [Halomonas sp. KAO]MDT0500992.1 2,3-bisphosphoglycerate-independent phosphoglycerate mutase [Halomonas sp. PAR7]MDT0512728.1 2,3-bisphosphoglycerate-independent phosphoglycerate mutase [Halomonas sp. LES1]MDT0591954.1 2,3-bisphosphoglycerate-independent phosphoglycerate mutase [Halomonas sp. PAR8]
MTTNAPRPVALIILDGYGHNPDPANNAVEAADTPVMDRLWAEHPHTLIHTDGRHVGLPDGQMGNSEVGHMNLGAGRVVYQDFTRITKAIEEGDLDTIEVLTAPIDAAVAAGRAVHLLGLLSPGGVHSHEEHILAAAELAARRGATRIFVHAFLDGRDMPPQSALASIEHANARLAELVGADNGFVASIIGRYFAMDRDNRWERVEKAYRLLTEGEGEHIVASAEAGLRAAYERGETDEFVAATSVRPAGEAITLETGDAALFMNFRADRARELTRAFVDESFEGFDRRVHPRLAAEGLVSLTRYAADIPAPAAFPPVDLHNTLGEVIESRGLTQLRIAETEKYPHVTFFFSGGREAEYRGEERILVPSPRDVKTYDEKPEMSAHEVTDRLVEAIDSGRFDLIVCNYANGDMVGHTGDFDAAVKAIETVDGCVGRVVEAIQRAGGACLVTADHGNAEQMINPETGAPQTAHTTFQVPLIYVGERPARFHDDGSLCDIAPTLLTMMEQPAPEEMSGRALLELD